MRVFLAWALTVVIDSYWTLSQWTEGYAWHHVTTVNDYWWAVLNASRNIGSSGFAHMYAGNGAILVALPGFQIFLAGVVRVVTLFGMSAPSIGLTFVHHAPSHQFVNGPAWIPVTAIAFAVGLAAIFPLVALARRCGIASWRLAAVTVATLAALSYAIVVWGHPDDTCAVGLLAWAFLRALDRRWGSVGWLLGLSIAVQPMVITAIPVVLGMAGIRRWPRMFSRMAIPGLLAVAIPLIGDPRDTLRQILLQPSNPLIGHATTTPFMAVVPHPSRYVADGGWPRDVAVLLACLISWLVVRRARELGGVSVGVLVWVAGLGTVLRCVFETELLPYYGIPAFVFLAMVAASRGWHRLLAELGAGALTLWLIEIHPFGTWGNWLVLTSLFALGLLIAVPERARRASPPARSQMRSDLTPPVLEPIGA